MRKIYTVLLHTIIIIIGISAFAFLLWEPRIEGRNAGATFIKIYFDDPFLIYAYTASLSFFIGLYQAFKLVTYIEKKEVYSEHFLKTLRNIQYCGTLLVCFVIIAEAYLFIIRPGDDIAGGVFIGLLGVAVSGAITSIARRFENKLQRKIRVW